ncbi:nuclear transport factor 2 family protein [Pseudonocardia sp. NPDC049635]|uniref:nuclear transport factor 2 family protein n=1 Tax=Pseudonocardia sp. NPDC049635 TaxID=3155506 RepID=UPI0033CAC819
MSTDPEQTARTFLTAYGRRDVDAALALVAPDARIDIFATGLRGGGPADLRDLLEKTARAFPDLLLTVRRVVAAGRVVAAEFAVEGTQAADYLGAINQEKHLDVAQAWRFEVDDGRITAVGAYWCANQLYRRLGVKRQDQIAIV